MEGPIDRADSKVAFIHVRAECDLIGNIIKFNSEPGSTLTFGTLSANFNISLLINANYSSSTAFYYYFFEIETHAL